MKPLLIFVPGIMGSELVYSQKLVSETREIQLWSENIWESLRVLSKNPSLLKLNPNATVSARSVIERLRLRFDILSVDLYSELLKQLTQLGEYELRPFPYDWRLDIKENAEHLGNMCKRFSERVDSGGISLVGHSMGGLLICSALVHGFILPKTVERVITIGTPFGGSPNAFRGLYSTGYIPALELLHFALNIRLDRRQCKRALLEAIQTFPSVYQLLPNEGHEFIDLAGETMINPLSARFHSTSNADQVNRAKRFHKELGKFSAFRQKNQTIKFLHVLDSGYHTDYFYEARVSPSGTSFERIKTIRTFPGDGTVPERFAEPGAKGWEIARYVGSKHMTMCSNREIIQRIMMELNT